MWDCGLQHARRRGGGRGGRQYYDSTTTVLRDFTLESCTDENSDLSIIAALCASSKRRDRSSQQEVLVRAMPLVPGIWRMA